MAHYKWLEEKKREAAAAKRRNKRVPSYGTSVRMRYIGNTGTGEDDIVQPDNPTRLINTSNGRRMLHEDEDVYVKGDGELMVEPSAYSQRRLRGMEQEEGIPGYQLGTPNTRRSRGVPPPEAQTPPVEQPSFTVQADRPTRATSITPMQTTTTAPFTVQADTPTRRGPDFTPIRVRPVETPTVTAPVTNASTAGSRSQPLTTSAAESFTPVDVPSTVQPPPTVETPAEPTVVTPTDTQPEQPAVPTAEDVGRATALGRLTSRAQGQFPGYDAAMQKYMDDLKATQDVERRVLAQRGAQAGLPEEVISSRAAMDRIAGRSALAEMGAQGAIGRAEIEQRAVSDLASQSLAGQKFEEDKEHYKDRAEWTAYEAALEAGDFNRAAAEYQSITGNPISMDEMQRYQEYLVQSREQSLATGDVTLDSLRNTYGDETFASLQGRIASGATREMINSELGTNISAAEFESMRNATALGERDWNRQLSAANMLLATPGAANKEQAATMYSEVFPGVDFDFNQIITDENSQRFGTGLSNMASYVSAGMSYDRAVNAMRADGTLEYMGMTEDQTEQLYNSMKVNAIDEQWSEVADSQWFQGLSAEDQEDMELFFTSAMKGDLDYDIVSEYEVYRSDGALDRTFTDPAQAQAYVAGNEGYTLKDTGRKRVVPRNLLTGATEGFPSAPVDKPVGTTYTEGDRVYHVGAGRIPEEISFTEGDDAWGSNAQNIIGAGPEGNAYYNEVLNARVQSVMNNTAPSSQITDEATRNAVSAQAPNVNSGGRSMNSGSVFTIMGELYRADESASPKEKFKATNLDTGESVTLYGNDSGWREYTSDTSYKVLYPPDTRIRIKARS